MKWFWLLLIVMLRVPVTYAQVSYGIKAGPNLSDVRFYLKDSWHDQHRYWQTTLGFHAGFFLSVPLTNRFSVRPELEFIQKGFLVKALPQGDQPKSRITFAYIQLPVLFSFKVVDKLYLEAGPAVGYRLSKSSSSDHFQFDYYMTLFEEKFELSVLGGVRFAVTENVGLALRYNYGLSNIIHPGPVYVQNPDTGQLEGFEQQGKNMVLLFSVDYNLTKR
jgi:hypothetical protein